LIAEQKPINALLIIVLFAGLLLAPSVAQIFGIGQSTQENRELAPLPTLSSLKDIKNLNRMSENYVSDRFGLRSQLVHFNSLLRYRMGISTNKDVVVGQDGWLFYAADKILEQHTGTNIFRSDELENWVRQMEKNRDWLEKRGIAFLVLVAPDKTTIYPEKLPDFPRRPGSPTRLEQLVARLRTSTLDFVDPRTALLEAKELGYKVYFEGDTHWTQRGALIAYSLLMERVRNRFSNVVPKTIDDFIVSLDRAPAADLARLLTLEGDLHYTVERFSLRGPSHQLAPPAITKRPSWPWRVTEMYNDLRDRPRLVIMGDSFSDYVLGPNFLYETFRDPVWTHHNLGTFNFELVREVKPDLVIFQFAERYLHSPLGIPIGLD
jgi:alginate O-acetyltransferase complex protein AlgJ